jgi:hypothetical protein
MKRFQLLAAIMLLFCGSAVAQSEGFMKLYTEAGEALNDGQAGITTTQLSGKMLQEVMPAKANEKFNVINRIDEIRQVKFAPQADKALFDKFVQMATDQGSTYEQMSQINEDGQKIQVFKAPYGTLKSEYLVLISKDNACLVCDITGNISMKDIMRMLYGK